MKSLKLAANANTWKKLMILGEKQGPVRMKDLAQELALPEQEALTFLRQIFPVGMGAEIYYQNEECWIDFTSSSLQYMLPISPSEWIKLHQTLQAVSDPSPVMNSLKQKISENGPIKVVMDLLSQLEAWDQDLSENEQALVKTMDEMISLKRLVQVTFKDGREISLFPHKVFHLEGSLSLIAEDFKDHCLMVTTIRDLKEVEEIPSTHLAKATDFEIDEFITAIRSMSEKETRLILKIFNPEAVNLFPDYQFLGKPCMVTNPNGDLIWAAYVEPCEALFDWLLSLESHVEILDPVNFKQEYLSYCEEKIRKIA